LLTNLCDLVTVASKKSKIRMAESFPERNAVSTLINDIKYSLRQLRKRPGFAITAMLTLALGLTVNTLMFSTVSDNFLRPLAVPDSEDLVVIAQTAPQIRGALPFSYVDSQDFRKAVEDTSTEGSGLSQSFSGMMAYNEQAVHLSRTNESTERAWIHMVSNNYFSVLGIQPLHGRLFLPSEGQHEGADPIIVLTHQAWQRQFNANPDILGQTVKLNGLLFTVVGITPPDFHGATFGMAYSGFIPATMLSTLTPRRKYMLHARGDLGFYMMGRLRPGVPFKQAQKAVDLFMSQLVDTYPDYHAKKSYAVVMRERASRPSPRVASFAPLIVSILMGLSLLVLIVTIANVTNLLFSRAANRQREIAIRGALGASRWRLLHQLLVESVLLALGAGVVGMILVLWLKPYFDGMAPTPTAPAAELGVDWRLFVFTFIASVVAGVCTGFIPALKATKLNLVPALKESNRSQIGTRHPWRSLLVTGQVAITVVVLVSAGLAVRSLQRLSQVSLGFRSSNLLLASFDLGLQNYTEDQGRRFQTQLLEKVNTLPQVNAVTLAQKAPLAGGGGRRGDMKAEGQPHSEDSRFELISCITVDEGFIETVGMSLREGRGFRAHDDASAPPVAIINQVYANHLWPNKPALGQRLLIGRQAHEVIGIIHNCRYGSMMDHNQPIVFRALAQNYQASLTLMVHTSGPATALHGPLQQIVRELDPDLPLHSVQTIEQQIANSPAGLMPMRMGAGIAGIQGLLSLLLAALGITGLVSFSVSQRTREIGIRLALGAQVKDIHRLVTYQSLRLTSIGLILGIVMALGVTHLLARLLYRVSPTDPVVFIGVILLITASTLIAGWLPARRATKTDPMEALRYE
jgi:putative ABC transport system permease protein